MAQGRQARRVCSLRLRLGPCLSMCLINMSAFPKRMLGAGGRSGLGVELRLELGLGFGWLYLLHCRTDTGCKLEV